MCALDELGTQLAYVKRRFDSEDIVWVVFAGAAAYVYGSGRMVNDVDILVRDEDLKKASQLFKRPIVEMKIGGKFNIKASVIHIEKIEVSAHIKIQIDKSSYPFSVDDAMVKKTRWERLFGVKAPIIPLEDNIIFKAMLQRGLEVGKHDIEDIQNMLKGKVLDKDYLAMRLKRCGIENTITPLLRNLGINL